MKSIEVVAAVIFDEQGRIFATQRGYGEWKDWWEFPGGKMESGETPQRTLDSAVTLLEHEAAKWLAPKNLDSVKWLPADEEIINELKTQTHALST